MLMLINFMIIQQLRALGQLEITVSLSVATRVKYRLETMNEYKDHISLHQKD